MKIQIALISFVLLFLFGCKKEESNVEFKYFDFSYNNTFETCFSVKFTPNDSVYIREHWNANNAFDSTNIPRAKRNYIGLISEKDKKH
ncbi:MAG: hypothetical protein ABI554_10660 [Flavobacterium sp.]